MIFIRSRSKWVLQFLMRRMLAEQSAVKLDLVEFEEEVNIISAESVRDAVAVFTIGPIILVYPFTDCIRTRRHAPLRLLFLRGHGSHREPRAPPGGLLYEEPRRRNDVGEVRRNAH